jgi:hypothetical protein
MHLALVPAQPELPKPELAPTPGVAHSGADPQVGDIFTCTWGYDQTNVDWYAIYRLSPTGKTAQFIRITAAPAEGHSRHTAGKHACCTNCLRAIRPLNTISGEQIWRHIANRDTRCSRYRDDDRRTAQPEILTRRLRRDSRGHAAANMNSYSYLAAWEGGPQYSTPIGEGH